MQTVHFTRSLFHIITQLGQEDKHIEIINCVSSVCFSEEIAHE